MTVQHIADLEPARRIAILVAQVSSQESRLADATLVIHDPIQPPAISEPTIQDAKALADRVHGIVKATVEARQRPVAYN